MIFGSLRFHTLLGNFVEKKRDPTSLAPESFYFSVPFPLWDWDRVLGIKDTNNGLSGNLCVNGNLYGFQLP